ncbi:MAG: hypothetical protein IJP30_01725 [Clostridia bacterium]|nr:hypothetical protein [Clostridia bacterium]
MNNGRHAPLRKLGLLLAGIGMLLIACFLPVWAWFVLGGIALMAIGLLCLR